MSEGLSKNQLKKLKKQEEAAKKKAEKAAANAAKAASEPQISSNKSKLENDEELDPTQYFENRMKAVQSMESSGVTAYPHKFQTTHRLPDYVEQFKS